MAELAQPQNGLVSAADILAKLAPTFIGSGTTTKSETESSTSGLGDLQSLLTGASNNAANPLATLQPVIDNIMRQAQVAFAPVAGQQNASGMYNSNVLSMLSSMAQGEAVRQSASVVSDYQTSQQKLALSAAGSLAQATKQTTGTAATGPAINPLASLGTIGAGIIGNKVINSPFVNRQVDSVGKALGIGGAAGTPTAALPTDFLTGNGKLFGDAASDTAQTVGDFVSGGSGNFANVGIPDIASSTPFESTGDLFSSFGVGGTPGDTAGTLFGDIGLTDVGTAAAGAGGSIVGDALGSVGDTLGSVGTGISDAASSVTDALSWIICTELVRQGRMNKRWYISGSKVFANYWEYGKRGYYLWAIPSVRHLRKKPDSLYSKILERVFVWRAEYLAACSGVRGARRLFRGYLLSKLLWITCAFLAVTVSPLCSDPDWLALYGKQELK